MHKKYTRALISRFFFKKRHCACGGVGGWGKDVAGMGRRVERGREGERERWRDGRMERNEGEEGGKRRKVLGLRRGCDNWTHIFTLL